VVVRTAFSVISAGTERAKVEVAKKSLLGKALARPDQLRQVLDSVRQVGLAVTWQKVSSRLDALSPLGYSSAGVVAIGDRGPDVMQPGDRVACAGVGYANHAEVVFVPRNLCVSVPSTVGLEEAACTTVGAIALQGVRQAEPSLGESVGVIGLGLVGLITVQLLKASGCRVLGVDVDSGRCQLAAKLGADVAVTPDDLALDNLARRLNPYGLDAVIITAATKSSEPITTAARLSRDRGRVVVVGAVGMDIPRSAFYEKELDLRLSRSYGPGRYDPNYEEKGRDYPVGYVRWTENRNMAAFLDLVAQGKVDVKALITHRFKIDEAEKAYELIEGKTQEPYLGVLLDYGLAEQDPGRPVQQEVIQVHPVAAARDRVGLALIGAGNFAQSMLLPHLKVDPHARLRTVVTAGGLTARSVAERAGFEQCASEPEAALNDPEVDLVVIASRHNSHADLTIRALEAGKAVFVEKPLALTAEELQAVVRACTSQKTTGAGPRFLMVGFNRRFAPLVVKLREFIQGCKEPLLMQYRVNAGYIPPEHWTQDPEGEGGRILGEVCHFIDLLVHLVGQPPADVYARALPDLGRYRQDNLAVILHFPGGSVGTVTYAANGDRGIGKERLEVFTGGRVGILEDFRHLTLSCGGRAKTFKSGSDKGHSAEMAVLIEAVRSGAPSPVPFDQLVAVTRATLAVLDSLATGEPVQVTGL
jgi:polar amino acid transport system substrate-binding protein